MNAVTVVAALVLSVAFSFHFDLFSVVPGLDVPFRYAFDWAATRQLEWGAEFISTYGGGAASVEEGGLWLTDLQGRLLPTDVVPTSSPDLSEWWAIAWADGSIGEVGFILRDPHGGWVPSCSRVALQ